jgi:hypothetical protein
MAIYLITQAKEGMSALSLRRFLDIFVNAAFKIKHKLQHVMKQADDLLLLQGFIEMDDVYWGNKRSGGKRGRGAPGKTPFIAAISRNKEGRPVHMRMSKLPAFTSANVKVWSRKHLDHESIVISDMYNPFNCQADLVAVYGQFKASKIYANPQNKIFRWLNTMIGNVKKAIHGKYHSVSSKHLPRYLAEFCFRFNNRFIIGAMVANLAQKSAQTKPRPQWLLTLAEE